MRFALFREVPKRQRKKKKKTGAAGRKGSDGSGDEESGSSEDEEEEAPAERMTTPAAATSRSATVVASKGPVPAPDAIWGAESQDVQMAVDDEPISTGTTLGSSANVRPERYG